MCVCLHCARRCEFQSLTLLLVRCHLIVVGGVVAVVAVVAVVLLLLWLLLLLLMLLFW